MDKTKEKKTEKKKKKGFHPIKKFRMSEELYDRLKNEKRGTWHYFFTQLLESYESDPKRRSVDHGQVEGVMEREELEGI